MKKTEKMRKFVRIGENGENGENETYTGKTAKEAATKAFAKSLLCQGIRNKEIDVDNFELKLCLEEIETEEKYPKLDGDCNT